MDNGRTIKQIERNHKANIKARALAFVGDKCVNTPKVENLKINGFQLLHVDELGRGHSTFETVTFTVVDTFRLRGIQYIHAAEACFDGNLTIGDWHHR